MGLPWITHIYNFLYLYYEDLGYETKHFGLKIWGLYKLQKVEGDYVVLYHGRSLAEILAAPI